MYLVLVGCSTDLSIRHWRKMCVRVFFCFVSFAVASFCAFHFCFWVFRIKNYGKTDTIFKWFRYLFFSQIAMPNNVFIATVKLIHLKRELNAPKTSNYSSQTILSVWTNDNGSSNNNKALNKSSSSSFWRCTHMHTIVRSPDNLWHKHSWPTWADTHWINELRTSVFFFLFSRIGCCSLSSELSLPRILQ